MDLNYRAHPDHSGLQVLHERDAPEVVSSWAPPEVVPEQDKYVHQTAALLPYQPFNEVEENTRFKYDPTTVPWWQRKRLMGSLIVVALLAIVGIVVGVVVGRRSPSSPSSSSSSSSPNSTTSSPDGTSSSSYPPSACRDTVCSQILSASILRNTQLMLFARGIDNAIWYTSASLDAYSFPESWTSLSGGGGGPFLTQPSSLTWAGSTRVSVLAASDPDQVVKIKTFTQSSSTPWEPIGPLAQSALSVCTVNDTRPDFWSTRDTTVAHNFWLGYEVVPDSFWAMGPTGEWQPSADFNTQLRGARPGVVCRDDGIYYHDLVVYDEKDGSVRHAMYRDVDWVRPASNRGGKFKGDPVVIGVGRGRFDFFGIGEDDNMWYFRWTKEGGYTQLENIGNGGGDEKGGFQSVPGVVVTGDVDAGNVDKVRIDVVALGKNDRLKHRVLNGGRWTEEGGGGGGGGWEDLGVFGNSAPLVVNLGKERVGVFVIGVDGQVNQTVWTVSEETSWKSLVWTDIGGNMTTGFYRT